MCETCGKQPPSKSGAFAVHTQLITFHSMQHILKPKRTRPADGQLAEIGQQRLQGHNPAHLMRISDLKKGSATWMNLNLELTQNRCKIAIVLSPMNHQNTSGSHDMKEKSSTNLSKWLRHTTCPFSRLLWRQKRMYCMVRPFNFLAMTVSGKNSETLQSQGPGLRFRLGQLQYHVPNIADTANIQYQHTPGHLGSFGWRPKLCYFIFHFLANSRKWKEKGIEAVGFKPETIIFGHCPLQDAIRCRIWLPPSSQRIDTYRKALNCIVFRQ